MMVLGRCHLKLKTKHHSSVTNQLCDFIKILSFSECKYPNDVYHRNILWVSDDAHESIRKTVSTFEALHNSCHDFKRAY